MEVVFHDSVMMRGIRAYGVNCQIPLYMIDHIGRMVDVSDTFSRFSAEILR